MSLAPDRAKIKRDDDDDKEVIKKMVIKSSNGQYKPEQPLEFSSANNALALHCISVLVLIKYARVLLKVIFYGHG